MQKGGKGLTGKSSSGETTQVWETKSKDSVRRLEEENRETGRDM